MKSHYGWNCYLFNHSGIIIIKQMIIKAVIDVILLLITIYRINNKNLQDIENSEN